MSNIITFRGGKPLAANVLELFRETEPWEPEYWLTKENIVRVTEELMHPIYINALHESLTDMAAEYPDLAEQIEDVRSSLRGWTASLGDGFSAQVQYFNDEGYGPTTRVWVLFINFKNGKADLRLYRNPAAAKGQVTKFFHRVLRCSN